MRIVLARRCAWSPSALAVLRDDETYAGVRDLLRARETAERPVVGGSIRRYATAVRDELDRSDPPRWGHPVPLVVHHHLHLTNNRLGVLPLQEAGLARMLYLARALGDASKPSAAVEAFA